jgi:valyl-tRNA synthetase
VVIAPWPAFPDAWSNPVLEERLARMQELIRVVREVRNRYTIDPKTAVDVFVRCDEAVAADFRTLAPFIVQLATVGRLECGPAVAKPKHAATHVNPEFESYVSLAGLIDAPAEIARLDKQIADKTRHLQVAKAKLADEKFVGRAPAAVVEKQRELVADLEGQLRSLGENLRELRQE